MAKIIAVGNAVVITSTLKLEELETVKKYRPKALTLWGGKEKDEPIFTISTGGNAGINNYGATFSDVSRDGEGLATITMVHLYEGDDIKEYVADHFGTALVNLNKLEETLPAVLEEIEAERTAMKEMITVA